MANEIEIRISGSNTSGGAFAGARRDAQDTTRQIAQEGRRAGQQWADGFTRDASGRLRDARGRFVSAGQKVTDGVEEPMKNLFQRIGSGFSAAGGQATDFVQTLMSADDPKAAFAKLGAFLTAAPVLAQAAGAGITLGVGGALAAVGLKAASANEDVQDAFAGMKERVVADLQGIARPFESTLIRISQVGEATWNDLEGSLGAAFGRMAPQVSDFAQDAGDAFGEFEPMIDRLSVAFGPLLDTLGDRLPDITGRLADSLTRMGEAADPQSLNMLIDAFTGLITAGTEVMLFLERSGAAFAKVWDGAKKAGGAVKDMFGGDTAGDAAGFGKALADVGAAALEAGAGVDELQSKIARLAGQELDTSEAMIGLERAIDDASESLRENGATLDINTEAGRRNKEALNEIARRALQVGEASKASGDDASTAMAKARRAFINGAVGANMSRKAAEALADRLGLVRQAANRVPGSKRITLRSNDAAVRHGINLLGAAVRGVPSSKTITFRTVGAAAAQSAIEFLRGFEHGGIVGAAGGGPRSNRVLVGEHGPEVVDLAPGSFVHTAGATRNMMSGGEGGGAVRVELVIDSRGAGLDDLLLEILRKSIRTRGGNVQVVLGGRR